MITVLIQPPPNFFAPYPAINPLNNLFMLLFILLESYYNLIRTILKKTGIYFPVNPNSAKREN